MARHALVAPAFLLGSLLMVAGCQGKSQTAPAPSSGPEARATAFPQQTSAIASVAEFQVDIDPATGTVKAEPNATRSGSRQGFIFDLDITNFLNVESFRIVGVEREQFGGLKIFFTHAHPFPAPDFTKSASGSNRADLGYTGRLVILADENSQTFFGGSVSVDPETIVAADGYAAVGNLLATTGLTNDTFPFVLLADESKDNRVGIPNGGMDGNYNAGGSGWDRSNIGAGNNGWTGFDFVHQGQTIRNSFTVSEDALNSGPLSMTVAIVIKYTDPRGGVSGAAQKLNKFPPATGDATKFAYRLPHAALDVSALRLTGNPVQMYNNLGNCKMVTCSLRDWDSLGTPGNDDDLSDDATVDTIVPGTGALPAMELDAPFLNPAAKSAVLVAYGEGIPGGELEMGMNIENTLGAVPPGNYFALVRATDPEKVLDSGYHYGVDPGSLAPTRPPLYDTFQVVPMEMVLTPANILGEPPSIYSTPCDDGGQPLSAKQFGVGATNNPTTILWDFGGGASPNNPVGNNVLVVLSANPGVYVGSVQCSNAFGTSPSQQFIFEVFGTDLDNPPPSVETEASGVVASGNGTFTFDVTDYTPPVGTAAIRVDWNDDGDFLDASETDTNLSGPPPVTLLSPLNYNNPTVVPLGKTTRYQYEYSSDGIARNGSVSWMLGPNQPPQVIAGTANLDETQIGSGTLFLIEGPSVITSDPELDPITYFGRGVPNVGAPITNSDGAMMITIGPFSNPPVTGNVVFSAWATDPAHPGTSGTPIPTSPSPLVGTIWESGWVRSVGGGSAEINFYQPSLAVDAAGNSYVVGVYYSTVDFGGGIRAQAGSGDFFVAKYDRTGAYVWDYTCGGGSTDEAYSVAVDSTGRVFVGGTYASPSINFGGGVRGVIGPADAFLVGLNPSGTYAWDRQFQGTGGLDNVTSILADNGGLLYASGAYGASADFGGGARAAFAMGDIFITRRNATTGAWLDDYTFGGTGTDSAGGAAFDPTSSSLALAGFFNGSVNFGGGSRSSNGGRDMFVVKLDRATLNWQWDRTFGGSGSDDSQTCAIDSAGNVILGYNWASTVDFGSGPRVGIGGNDIGLVKLNGATGAWIWDDQWQTAGMEELLALTVGPGDRMILGGYYTNPLNIEGGPMSNSGSSDAFVAALDSAGNWLWDYHPTNGVGSEQTTSIALAPDGSVRVYGHFVSAGVDFQPGGAVTSRTPIGSSDFFLVGLNGIGWW